MKYDNFTTWKFSDWERIRFVKGIFRDSNNHFLWHIFVNINKINSVDTILFLWVMHYDYVYHIRPKKGLSSIHLSKMLCNMLFSFLRKWAMRNTGILFLWCFWLTFSLMLFFFFFFFFFAASWQLKNRKAKKWAQHIGLCGKSEFTYSKVKCPF